MQSPAGGGLGEPRSAVATRARSGNALQPAPRCLAWRFPTQSRPATLTQRTLSRPELRGVPLGPRADPSVRLSPVPSHAHAGRRSSWRGGRKLGGAPRPGCPRLLWPLPPSRSSPRPPESPGRWRGEARPPARDPRPTGPVEPPVRLHVAGRAAGSEWDIEAFLGC